MTTSAVTGATNIKGNIIPQSFQPTAKVPKNVCKKGIYRTPSMRRKEKPVAHIIQRLEKKPIEKIELVSDLDVNARSNSEHTRVVNAMV